MRVGPIALVLAALSGCGGASLPSEGELGMVSGKSDVLSKRRWVWKKRGEVELGKSGTYQGRFDAQDDGEVVVITGDWLKIPPMSAPFKVSRNQSYLNLATRIGFIAAELDGGTLNLLPAGGDTCAMPAAMVSELTVNPSTRSYQGHSGVEQPDGCYDPQGTLPGTAEATLAVFAVPLYQFASIKGTFDYTLEVESLPSTTAQ